MCLVTYPSAIQGNLRVAKYFKQSSPKYPLISILIATLNSQEFLESTLLSIFNQSYKNMEYSVIDGGVQQMIL
ncbi:hypothetical protein [Helicobacter suis]|uniref:hypothetical protein n=1 Tax=Helicobacter suis TaxID=104628 RepID=UPI0013D6F35C|nr:hypothetical protein [Helicobacter suis]